MNTIEKYSRGINEKTLVILCNDCNKVIDFFGNKALFIASSFGNIIDEEYGFDEAYFRYFIEQKHVERILLAGHTECDVVRQILNEPIRHPYWSTAQKELVKLKELVGPVRYEEPSDRNEFLSKHIANQVQKMRNLLNSAEVTGVENIRVEGILLDDGKNEVMTVNVQEAEAIHNLLN